MILNLKFRFVLKLSSQNAEIKGVICNSIVELF